jgi:hypothetical protein
VIFFETVFVSRVERRIDIRAECACGSFDVGRERIVR